MLILKKKYSSRINNVTKINKNFILKSPGTFFYRGVYTFDPAELIKIEIRSLRRLESIKHFPSILSSPDSTSFVMTNNGTVINKNSIPNDWMSQVSTIVEALEKYRIIHRDIKTDNILVDKRGLISLIDFGWSMIDEEYYISPRDFQHFDKKLIYNNEYALYSVLESLT